MMSSSGSNQAPRLTLSMFEVVEGSSSLPFPDVVLGRGSFGSVVRVKKKGTDEIYALKTIAKADVVQGFVHEQIEGEILIHKRMDHKNVLKMYAHFEDATNVYLLLEYCSKGELYQYMQSRNKRRFKENEAAKLFAQIVQGVLYLHGQGVMHRDIKPENILLTDKDVVKISDFGWCNDECRRQNYSFCGTWDYLAPEMISGAGHDHRIDIWQLGVVLYELVIGKPPFHSTQHKVLIRNIQTLKYSYPQFLPVSHEFRELVSCLLQINPAERMPLEKVLEHPWIARRIQQPFGSRMTSDDDLLSSRTLPRNVADIENQITRESTGEYRDMWNKFGKVPDPVNPLSHSVCLDGSDLAEKFGMARVSEDRVELTGVPPYLSANTGSPSLRGQARAPAPTLVQQSPLLGHRALGGSYVRTVSPPPAQDGSDSLGAVRAPVSRGYRSFAPGDRPTFHQSVNGPLTSMIASRSPTRIRHGTPPGMTSQPHSQPIPVRRARHSALPGQAPWMMQQGMPMQFATQPTLPVQHAPRRMQ